MQRIALFLATNLAIILVVSFIYNLITNATGYRLNNAGGLLIFCALFGFGGAFVSLWLSRWMALCGNRRAGHRDTAQCS